MRRLHEDAAYSSRKPGSSCAQLASLKNLLPNVASCSRFVRQDFGKKAAPSPASSFALWLRMLRSHNGQSKHDGKFLQLSA